MPSCTPDFRGRWYLLRRMAKPTVVLIAICLAAFGAITLISGRVFEHLPHSEDEVAYLFQAKVFAQNRLVGPTPQIRQAFWTPFVLDYQGQRFGKYAPGWPFLLSFGFRLNAPWLVNTVLATITLALIARLGYCFYGGATQVGRSLVTHPEYPADPPRSSAWIGVSAAGLGLVTPGFLILSGSLLSHTASLFWVTLALTGLFYLTRQGVQFMAGEENELPTTPHASRLTFHVSHFPAILTGSALGAAFVTRPFAGIGIGLAVGIFLFALIYRREINWTVLLWIALGGLPVALLSPLYWWAITGNPTFNAYLLVWPYDRVGFGPDIGPFGYTFSDALLINTRLKLTILAIGLFGWPGWSNLLFLPVPFLARRANRWDWLLVGTILSLIFVHIFYWSFGGADGGFPRYYYDALPAFLFLTVRGIQISMKYLGRWLPAGLVIVFMGYSLIWSLPPLLAAQKSKYGITPAQLQAVKQAHVPTPALVIVKNVQEWSDFAAPFAANSPALDGSIVYASDEGAEVTQVLQKQFKERSCWELDGENLTPCK